MNSFAFEFGRAAAKRRNATKQEQSEPPGSSAYLEQWRLGYGGPGKPCQSKTPAPTAAASAASAPSLSPAAKVAQNGFAAVAVATAKPATQARLFGETREPTPVVKPAQRERPHCGPMPVPIDEVDDEIGLLMSIGIGMTEADDLVRKHNWTLDALVCQCKLGNEHCLPSLVMGRVAKYAQQKWSQLRNAHTVQPK